MICYELKKRESKEFFTKYVFEYDFANIFMYIRILGIDLMKLMRF